MKVLLLLALLGAAQAQLEAPSDSDMDSANIIEKFEEFIKFFKKEYKSVQEFLHRVKAYGENLRRLPELRKEDPNVKISHLSPLMDMTEAEFKARNNLDMSKRKKGVLAATLDTSDTPSSWDWREHGAVNPIKDQKQCGSCWTFGTVANIESVNVVQGKGQLYSCSEQELVDCSEGGNGCSGGWPDRAFADLIDRNYGLTLEADYPYTAQDGTCSKDSHPQQLFIQNYVDISQDEDQIAAALVKYGVLSIAINANPMQMYQGGIADPANCNPQMLDHAVNLVGFGEEGGTKYWTIRNSWGSWWGENGYYRIVRGVGKCGLNTAVSTAIINPGQGEQIVV